MKVKTYFLAACLIMLCSMAFSVRLIKLYFSPLYVGGYVRIHQVNGSVNQMPILARNPNDPDYGLTLKLDPSYFGAVIGIYNNSRTLVAIIGILPGGDHQLLYGILNNNLAFFIDDVPDDEQKFCFMRFDKDGGGGPGAACAA